MTVIHCTALWAVHREPVEDSEVRWYRLALRPLRQIADMAEATLEECTDFWVALRWVQATFQLRAYGLACTSLADTWLEVHVVIGPQRGGEAFSIKALFAERPLVYVVGAAG